MWFVFEFVFDMVTLGAFARSDSTPIDKIVNRALFLLLIVMGITVFVLAKAHR